MKAYNLIEQYGWLQRAYGNKQTGFCMMGALYEVYPYAEACKYRAMIEKRTRCRAAIWNDRIRRTKQQVITLLKKVEGVAR